MRSLPAPRLVPLTDAFNRVGAAYIEGWDGSERAIASLGQRSRGSFQAWKRAHEALRFMERLVHDGTIGLVAYDENGGRIRYFEGSTEVISMLLLSPDVSAAGLIEFHSGKVSVCELDLSGIKLRSEQRGKPGRKQEYLRYRQLVENALERHGPRAPNAEIKRDIQSHIGSDPYPSKSTANEIIGRTREVVMGRWAGKSTGGQFRSVVCGGATCES